MTAGSVVRRAFRPARVYDESYGIVMLDAFL